MGTKVRFEKNEAGFRELLNGGAIQGECLSRAQRCASAAQGAATYRNASYTADCRAGANRCHARAKTASEGAWWNEMAGGKGSGPLAHTI